jgi:hypothetical protein
MPDQIKITLECWTRVTFTVEPFVSDAEAMASAQAVEREVLVALKDYLPADARATFNAPKVVRDNLSHYAYLELAFTVGTHWVIVSGALHGGWQFLRELFPEKWKEQHPDLVVDARTEVRQVNSALPNPTPTNLKPRPILAAASAFTRRWGVSVLIGAVALVIALREVDDQKRMEAMQEQLRTFAERPQVAPEPPQSTPSVVNVNCPPVVVRVRRQ